MSTLFHKLPSFATDYSGFISLMHGLGGLMVVHDPSGCLGNYTNADEPRWFHDPQPVYSTRLRELEAILGDDRETKERILTEIRRSSPPFVCILGTSVPALTGCDLTNLAEYIENQSGIPCFAIETDGFHFYDVGIQKALALMARLMDAGLSCESGRVNVLGMTPLDYSLYGEKKKLISLIEQQGCRVGAFLGMGDSLSDLAAARKAEKNIVMTAAALPMARKMEQENGIAFFAGPPVGEYGAACLAAFLKNSLMPALRTDESGCGKTLIIGEQLASNALRRSLHTQGQGGTITVASFFIMDEKEKEEGDVPLHSEKQLQELLASGNYMKVIGDPLLKAFCREEQVFIPRAHPAVSSKLYWKKAPSLVG